MTKANYIQWLETQIVKAQELGGMDLEIWAFRQCLKKARDLGQELPIPDVVGRSEQLKAEDKDLSFSNYLEKWYELPRYEKVYDRKNGKGTDTEDEVIKNYR